MKVFEDGKSVKVGQVIRTCSVGNIRIEKCGRKIRTVTICNTKYGIGVIEKDGEIVTRGFIGELLEWDTERQPFSLDNIPDVVDQTVDPDKKYKCLSRWFKSHR